MVKSKKVFALVLVVVMIFSLMAGCGGKTEDTSKDASKDTSTVTTQQTSGGDQQADAASKEKRKVVFSTINNYYTTALKQIAKDYTALHPETEVEIEIIADNETYAKNFSTKMAADKKSAPDIIHTNVAVLGGDNGEYINKGWFTALDDLLNEPNPYNDNLPVKDAFTDPTYLTLAVSSIGKVAYLPFDLVGVGVYYNKDIFDKAGIAAPETYEDWSAACKKLLGAGYKNPIGASAFAEWTMVSMADWAYRKYIPELVTVPGDGRYTDALKANTEVKYTPEDPAFDMKAVLDPEKFLVLKKGFDRKSDISKKMWETFKDLSQYFQKGWTTPDEKQVYANFMSQRIPMFISGSWYVGTILGDMNKISDASKKFKWATFKFPKFAQADPNFPGEPRGLLVAGHQMGIAQKDDPEQYKRAADFLKYMYSPKIATQVYDITLSKGEYVQGPSLIKGVTLSPEVDSYISGFRVSGNMRQELSGLETGTLQTETGVWNDLKLKYTEGKVTFDEFVAQKEKLYQNYIADTVKKFGYDMDPKTAEAAVQ